MDINLRTSGPDDATASAILWLPAEAAGGTVSCGA